MKMSKLEKLGIESSLLGFGCMRLPVKDGKIEREEAFQMVDYAYQHGITYYDTAYAYHGGESEIFLGEALKKYPRDSFYLATKMPIWLINNKDDMEKVFNIQLERLQVEYFDFYLIHAVDLARYHKCKDIGVFSFLEEKRAEGKIKYIGFSFHDKSENFEEIVDGYNWDVVQIQTNYVDVDLMNSQLLYDVLDKRNIPCIVMEPIRGGYLANLPDDIGKPFKDYNPQRSYSSWALSWVAQQENIKIVLSGMSAMEHMVENIATINSDFKLSEKEMGIIDEVVKNLKAIATVPCTGCGYCMPCPCGVDIPSIFNSYNTYKMFGNLWRAFNEYHVYFPDSSKPINCTKCMQCEAKCPQQIKIAQELMSCHEVLEPLKETFANDPRTKTSLED